MLNRFTVFAAAAAAAAARLRDGSGPNLQLFPCNASNPQPFQAWQWRSADQTVFLVGSQNMCIDINNYGVTDGSIFWTYTCHQSDKDPAHQNQEFTLDASTGAVVSTMSKKCMTTSGAYAGSSIVLGDCDGSARQSWSWDTTSGLVTNKESGMCLDAGSPLPPPCARPPFNTMDFCNVSLSMDARVADIIARLSPATKYGLFNTQAGPAAEIGQGPYQWWSEALHGVADSPGVSFGNGINGATSFPQVCTTAMTWNASMFRDIGAHISTEARAMANVNQAGLTFWTPNINIFRDPRWGRGQETPGEDPTLNAAYASHFIPGMQEGDDPRYIKASACCKHYAAYSLEQWNGTDRHHFDAVVSDQDMSDTYFPAFQSCAADARSSGMMCSYNSVNGVPSCASFFLNTEVFREEWGFNGYITSDCGAVSDIIDTHQYTHNSDDTCKAVMTSGMDIGCDGYLPPNLPQAVTDGAVTMANIDASLTNLFMVRMRLGVFDPPEIQPYTQITPSAICTNESIALAQKVAEDGITLLKNSLVGKALPLAQASIKSLAVIGPNAEATGTMQGNYYGNPCFNIPSIATVLQGYATVQSLPGCMDGVPCNNASGFGAAAAAAAQADATIVVIGNDQGQESEGHDRTIIALPGQQEALVTQVCNAARGPCIVVVLSGSSLDVSTAQGHANVSAILFAGYPGQSGAAAVARIIFGQVVPAGRLVQTFYHADYVNQISMFEMNMRPGPSAWPPGNSPGRTYRFFPGPVVYPFGFGLSYTTFSYAVSGPDAVSMALTRDFLATKSSKKFGSRFTPLSSDVTVNYSVNVTNTGTVDADDAVLGFLVPPGSGTDGVPLQELFGFQRVHVPAGQTVTVWLGVQARHLTRVLEDGSRVAWPGTWTLRVGPHLGSMAAKPAPGQATTAYAEVSFTTTD